MLLAGSGKAVCLAQGDKPDQGIAVAEKIIAEGDPADAPLFARAYMALGACYEAQGKTMDALLAYLHVDLLFYQDAALHAEALYHLEKLWTKAKRPDRALKARTLLQSRYPGSVWAQK